mmetsp:Transcript_40036/g.55638  ORF Transcript_40036/g.55638 Transcript_40036/m.55638 type:complete len:165 (+) Transcript_40036:98-592(+)|eukprot:CAMPEP_0196581252 /NCGR_PEP_ID=MMETSP1081-20130531/33182_1 /TAXON_ID=36882 /ORGANISM="Pyramimonas amylifera, Strain CCMP720" /LENGTH=164 /DNA_ID=CAMNT_0041901409 /DNA_START=91 /DNA_END=585 /DNA_ORIENTATION=-
MASSNSLARGKKVTFVGLKGRPDLNGKEGVLVSYVEDVDRWIVEWTESNVKECIKVKAANLECGDDYDGDYVKVKINDQEMFLNAEDLKRKFQKVSKKYHLDSEENSTKIANFLTDDKAQKEVSPQEFAKMFGLADEDAVVFLQYINMMVSFKEQWMDAKELGK